MFGRKKKKTLRERIAEEGLREATREEVGKAKGRLAERSPERRSRNGRRKAATVAGAAAAGAAAAYYLDPDRGNYRRKTTKDRIGGLVRTASRRGERVRRRVASDTAGFAERQVHGRPDTPPPNDVTLARKVESEVLGRPDIPKGSINVDAADGVVALRGEVKQPELIREIEDAVRAVTGVRDVENLLHLPGTSAPNVEPSRGAGR